MKLIVLFFLFVLIILSSPFTFPRPVEAAFCRAVNHQQVCITSIKRSAKNYWEYRVVLSVDGMEKPLELFNCRDRVRIQQDGTPLPFEPEGLGEQICRLFK
mgnify:CR=1 FL=1